MMSLFFRDSSRKASADPLSGFWYGAVSAPTASREPVTEETALTYSAVWAATRLLSGTIGWLPLDLYRRLPAGGREVAIDDPRETMIHDRPNDDMTAMMFRCQAVAQQLNAGNCYAEIERDESKKRRPVKLWPIHHARVKVHRDMAGLWYEVKNNDGSSVAIDAKDMIHVPYIISDDGVTGKGIIQAARESIGFGLATEKYGASWFGKGGVPRLALSHPGKLSPEARANMRSEWREAYGGPDGSKVAVLQEGVTLQAIGISNEDSQFLETRGYNVKELARWYGVPPHKIGDLDRATFSNIEHQAIEFRTDSLMLLVKSWEQELWAKLLSPEEQATMYFEFNTTAILRGDEAARASFYTSLSNIGALNRNEIREFENLNPVPGGDVFLVQGAMFAVGDDGIPVNTTAAPAEPVETEDPEETEDAEDAMDVAAREMFAKSLSRLAYKEAQAATRAANNPGGFDAWMDEFYAKHAEQLNDELSPVLVALGKTQVVEEWCRESRDVLMKATNAKLDVFPAVVAKCVSQWSTTRVAEVVSRLTEQKA